jgi:hypothetical protein
MSLQSERKTRTVSKINLGGEGWTSGYALAKNLLRVARLQGHEPQREQARRMITAALNLDRNTQRNPPLFIDLGGKPVRVELYRSPAEAWERAEGWIVFEGEDSICQQIAIAFADITVSEESD